MTMGGDPFHSHTSTGIQTAKAHAHDAGDGADVTTVSAFDTDGELARHTHDADVGTVAMAPEAPADAHTHTNVDAHSGDPIHSHTAEYEAVAGQADMHDASTTTKRSLAQSSIAILTATVPS